MLRLAMRLPLQVVASPERVVLNYAFILIGLVAFESSKEVGGAISLWPLWIRLGWGLCMIVGGASVLFGMFRHSVTVERLGYLLIAPASVVYAVSVLSFRGWSGVPVFLIFLSVALAKVIRLVITSAERDLTIELGERLLKIERDEKEEEDGS
jgi:hypothetical protein